MNGKAAILFVKELDNFFAVEFWGDVSAELRQELEDDPPHVEDATALAKFYASGLLEGAYDLTPIPGSTYTHAYFWRDDSGGITVIKGRYW